MNDDLKIREGAFYKTLGGAVHGPMRRRPSGHYDCPQTYFVYSNDGLLFTPRRPARHPDELVEEYFDQSDLDEVHTGEWEDAE